ncbi:MAG: hypothetical protein ACF8TS_17290 [Maioricimonas sp. JB049]
MLAAFSLVIVMAGIASAEDSLRAQFEREYPAAQQRLRRAVDDASGFGHYDHIRHDFRKGESTTKRGEFHFFKSADSVRFHLLPADEANEPDEFVAIRRPGEVFGVRRSRQGPAELELIAGKSLGKVRRVLGVYWRDYLAACYSWFEHPVADWLDREGLTVTRVEPYREQPGWIRVAFEYDGRHLFRNPDDCPPDYRGEGYWIFDPEQDWAIRKTWYRDRYSFEGEEFGSEDESVVTVQTFGSRVVPRRVGIISRRLNDAGSYEEVESKTFEFEEVAAGPIAAETFTLQAVGVADPRGLNRRFLLVNAGLLLVAGLFIAGLWIVRSRQRNRSQS